MEEKERLSVVLASKSKPRANLLRQIGIDPIISPVDIEEEMYFASSEDLIKTLKALAEAKARRASVFFKHNIIIGADTIISFKDKIHFKPTNMENAKSMLRRISGKEHKVITAVVVINTRTDKVFRKYSETIVKFMKLTEEDINWYVSTGEVFDKAGAYAIQGRGAIFVRSLVGSYSNVVGLPLYVVTLMLKKAGYIF